MLKRFLTGAAIAFAASLCVAGAASAAVVNFNGNTAYGAAGDGFDEGGLRFDGYQMLFIPPDQSNFPGVVTSPFLATWREPMTITLTAPQGDPAKPFDLNSISMALGWYQVSADPGFTDVELVTGQKADCSDPTPGACSVTQSFNVGYGFQSFTFEGFTNLSSVTFSPLTTQMTIDDNGAPFAYSGWIGYDNINFTAPGVVGEPVDAVPEPAAWALMIVGFGGVGAMIRRARRAPALAAA